MSLTRRDLLTRAALLAGAPWAAHGRQALLPDVRGVIETGEAAALDEIMREKVTAMQFVFTSCTATCPLLGSLFARIQGDLGPGYRPSVLLLSVSVDPENDTPSKLRRFLAQHRAEPGWHALLLRRPDLDRLLIHLDEEPGSPTLHSPQTVVFDGRRQLVRRFRELATAAEVAAAIRAAHG